MDPAMSCSYCAAAATQRTKQAMPVDSSTWAALPRDILITVFLELGPTEVMLGAEHVCTAWRRVALKEPALWRRIGWRPLAEEMKRRVISGVAEKAMERVALARAAGRCEAFKGCLDYEDLSYLVQRASSLKDLCIEEFHYKEGAEELISALKKLPLLENLKINSTYTIRRDVRMLQSICQACPNLKNLMLMYGGTCDLKCNEFHKELTDGEMPMMNELRILRLYECDLTRKGLESILNNCPKLEVLHITGYFDKRDMNEELRVKCAGLQRLILPTTIKPPDFFGYYYDCDESSDSEEG